MRTLRLLLFVALGVAATACGGCDEVPSEDVDGGFFGPRDEDPPIPGFCGTSECACVVGIDGGFCRTKYCGLIVEPGIVVRDTVFRVRETEAPEESRDEIIGGRACQIEPIDARLRGPFEALAYYDESEIPLDFFEEEVVAALVEPELRLPDEWVLETGSDRVSLQSEAAVTYGATLLPAEPMLDGEFGLGTYGSASDEDYIRNLSRYDFSASFHDGVRFYAANGPRVLIWNDGVPDHPLTPPDLVLGRPDLEAEADFTSASNFAGPARSVWSDGRRLAVAESNRVLIWNRIPTQSYAAADVVLGQDDFTSNERNRGGGPAADTLAAPMSVTSDGTRLVVAERLNHRYLVWNQFPHVNGQPADLVIGQQDFDENTVNAGALPTYEGWSTYLTEDRLALVSRFSCECFSVLDGLPTANNPAPDWRVGLGSPLSRVDPTTFSGASSITGFGGNGVALRNGHRVSVWRDFPTETRPADFTLGKPDDTIGGVLGRISASSFADATPFGHVWANEDYMFVGDGRRLLIWRGLPRSSFEAADLVIGQPGFTTNDELDYRGIQSDTLAAPTSVSSAGELTAIADRANNRVLVLTGDPTAPKRVVVLGQLGPDDYFPNRWAGASAETLSAPSGVFTDGTRIVVADSGNHRVLVWNEPPTRNGAPADLVLGQPNFESTAQNAGEPLPDSDTLHYPSDVWFDGRLFVADEFNHRVLVWNEMPATNGQGANAVIGQPDYTSVEPNRGLGWYARGADTLSRPTDVVTDESGQLIVADSENNRVLVFNQSRTGARASAALGQTGFTSDASPNYNSGTNVGHPLGEDQLTVGRTTLRRPTQVAWRNGTLAVADPGNHRVVEFERLHTGAAASRVYGQEAFHTRVSNEDAVSARSLRAPEGVAFDPAGRLLVADTLNHRLLAFDDAPEAVGLFGQPNFERNGWNGSSPAVGTLEGPAGLAYADGSLWVADRRNHRVVRYRDGRPQLVLGQPDEGSDFPDAGLEEPLGWTLHTPSDVWTDGTRLVVADRDNHRVLIWNEPPEVGQVPADVVLGQRDPYSDEQNGGNGAAAGASTMLAPEGVHVDGDVLYVADTGNNRVLVFDPMPTESGAPATAVLCHEGFTTNGANRGGSPTAETCANPTDVLTIDGSLWVADTGNNRVLRYGEGPAADLVLGQPDFQSREALDEQNRTSAARLQSPVRLAYDDSNLWVVDRGNHRVLIWNELPNESFTPADRLIGQVDFDTNVVTTDIEGLESPLGIAVEHQPYHSARVFISDAGKNRVVTFDRVARFF